MAKGFTLLEVIIAVAIVGFSFGSFLALASQIVSSQTETLKTALATVAAHNALNRAIYLNEDFSDEEVELLGYTFKIEQDFEELMGFRVVKVSAGGLVELYEAR